MNKRLRVGKGTQTGSRGPETLRLQGIPIFWPYEVHNHTVNDRIDTYLTIIYNIAYYTLWYNVKGMHAHSLLAKKGGVGKSLLARLLHEACRQARISVALRDWDAQGTSTKALRLSSGQSALLAGTYEVLLYDTPPNREHVATGSAVHNTDIARCDLSCTGGPLGGGRGPALCASTQPSRCGTADLQHRASGNRPGTAHRRQCQARGVCRPSRPSLVTEQGTSMSSARAGRRWIDRHGKRCRSSPWLCSV